MTDFAAAWATKHFDFTSGVWREFVMVEVAFGDVAIHAVDDLGVAWTTEGGDGDGHGFAALENCRTVSAWKHIRNDVQWADIGEFASVETGFFFQDIFAHVFFERRIEVVCEFGFFV